MTMYWILFIVGGFLLGSIMNCQIIPKVVRNVDIYALSEDHNSGTYNVYKLCGMGVALPCLLLDVSKGFLPVVLAAALLGADGYAFSLVMLAPVLGHAIGVFNRFHGGKSIAASFGVMAGLIPITVIPIIVLPALFIALTFIKNRNARCVAVYVLFALITCPILAIMGLGFVAVGCGAVALVPILKFTLFRS